MKTIKKETEIIFEEKKSKFIGYIKPVFSKEDAENFILKIKTMHKNATHNCSAYKLFQNGQEFFKTDDDGEPKGTAGKPMGDIITYTGAENLVIVTTRYFGGIKLGAGGLVRAYAKAAKLAIQEAEIIDYIEKNIYLIEFPYDKNSEIEQILYSNKDEIIEKGYHDKVFYKAYISKKTLNTLKNIRDIILIKI